MEWLEPWWSTEEQGEDFRETFRRQLELELSPGHKLFGVPLRLIGRHEGSDDALFEFLDGSGRVAVVHLTWQRGPEVPPWPRSTIYQSLEAWSESDMKPEHEAWSSE